MFRWLLGIVRQYGRVRVLDRCSIGMLMRRVVVRCRNGFGMRIPTMVRCQTMCCGRPTSEGKCHRRCDDADGIKRGDEGHRSCSPSSGQPSQHARSRSILRFAVAHIKSRNTATQGRGEPLDCRAPLLDRQHLATVSCPSRMAHRRPIVCCTKETMTSQILGKDLGGLVFPQQQD
jgi:hypothetical protein